MTLAVQSCSQLSISLAFHPHLEKKIEMKSPEGSQESCVCKDSVLCVVGLQASAFTFRAAAFIFNCWHHNRMNISGNSVSDSLPLFA